MELNSSNIFTKTCKNEVVADRGVIVSNHPLASSAGIEMFALGGNAFDASVASLFTLTVVSPSMVGIFGAGFFVLRDTKTGKIETVNNHAVSPIATKEDIFTPIEDVHPPPMYLVSVGRKNYTGHLSVAIGGALKGWEYIVEKYGALSLPEVIGPAIRYARNGFRASKSLVYSIERSKKDLQLYPETAKVFLPEGKPPNPGDLIMMSDYADTLEKIAEGGSDVLYQGELAKVLVDDMEENGGIITLEDLAQYELIIGRPSKGTYRSHYEIYSTSPVFCCGAQIIQVFNILEEFDVTSLGFGSAEHIHLFAEALKIAYADRERYMAPSARDPNWGQIPTSMMLSKRYAKERAKQINFNKAHRYAHGEPKLYEGASENTTHVSAMDSDGNIVSTTQTQLLSFGSKVTTPGTGMLLNNCMVMFDPRPGKVNSPAPRARMLTSVGPVIILRDSEPFMCIGTPGGTRIWAAICQAIINVIDFGTTLQQAIEAPRIWTMGIPSTMEKTYL